MLVLSDSGAIMLSHSIPQIDAVATITDGVRSNSTLILRGCVFHFGSLLLAFGVSWLDLASATLDSQLMESMLTSKDTSKAGSLPLTLDTASSGFPFLVKGCTCLVLPPSALSYTHLGAPMPSRFLARSCSLSVLGRCRVDLPTFVLASVQSSVTFLPQVIPCAKSLSVALNPIHLELLSLMQAFARTRSQPLACAASSSGTFPPSQSAARSRPFLLAMEALRSGAPPTPRFVSHPGSVTVSFGHLCLDPTLPSLDASHLRSSTLSQFLAQLDMGSMTLDSFHLGSSPALRQHARSGAMMSVISAARFKPIVLTLRMSTTEAMTTSRSLA